MVLNFRQRQLNTVTKIIGISCNENNCFFYNNGVRGAGTDEGCILNTFVTTKEQVTESSLEGALELEATL